MLPPQTPAITPKNNSAENQRYSLENSADSIQNVGAGLAPALKVLMENTREGPLPKPTHHLKINRREFQRYFPENTADFQSKTYKQGLPSPIS